MDYAHGVGSIQYAHDGSQQFVGLGSGELSTFSDFRIKRLAFDILHHHINGAVACSAEIIDSDRIWMSEPSCSLPFSSKSS
jgi:hypothetical protein